LDERPLEEVKPHPKRDTRGGPAMLLIQGSSFKGCDPGDDELLRLQAARRCTDRLLAGRYPPSCLMGVSLHFQ
jgi:hypothetical protein